MYYIYFLYSESADKYYVGHSQDSFKRREQLRHAKGIFYTSFFGPLKCKTTLIREFMVTPSRRNRSSKML
jgi:predicted GIY-YIG superfamily endonuclease